MELHEALERAPETKHFEAGEVLDKVAEIFVRSFGNRKAVVVADENTMQAAGRRVQELLDAAGIQSASAFVFDGSPTLTCDYANVGTLKKHIEEVAAIPIAVGSGTLNDLVKVAADECGIRYMVVATAASVDGFTSRGASILRDGFKKTIPCAAPLAVLADTGVLVNAPAAMSAAGYGDLAGKLTAGADWLIADSLRIEPVDPFSWRIVQEDLGTWIAHPEGVPRRDPQAFRHLITGLTMTGLAMQVLAASRPASGSEHLVSHIWEMNHLAFEGEPVSHGFKVAIGTLTCTAIMERLAVVDVDSLDIESRLARWPSWAEREAQIRSTFRPAEVVEKVVEESRAKYVDTSSLQARMMLLREKWAELTSRVHEQLLPYAEIRRRFQTAGCPVTPEQIGASRDDVPRICRLAAMIRNRYTVLDLIYEMGLFDTVLDEVMSSAEYLR